MTYPTGAQGQQAPVIDGLPPDGRTDLPNGTSVYSQREAGWFMAVDGVLKPYTPKSGRGRLIVVLSVFAAIILGIVTLAVVRTIQKGPMFGAGPTLVAAEKECNRGRSGGDLSDGGKTLVIDMKGESPAEQVQGGMEPPTFTCLLDALDTSSSVRAHIAATRAIDGRQTEKWGDFTAFWSYDPDSGLDMTIIEN